MSLSRLPKRLNALCLLLFFWSIPALSASIEWTPQERAWLEAHPEVTVAAEKDWAPYDFVDGEGRHAGMVHEILAFVSRQTGIRFKYAVDDWHRLMERTREGEIDLLPLLYYDPARSRYLDFSDPYMNVQDYVYIHSDRDSRTFGSLGAKTVAIPKGFSVKEKLQRLYPNIVVLEVDTVREAIFAVLEHRADAVVDNYAVINYHLRKLGVQNLKPYKPFQTSRLYMATRPGRPVFLGILNKVLATLSTTEKEQMLEQWTRPLARKAAIVLTPEERRWIREHPSIRLGADAHWPPFDFLDDSGRHAGIAADFLALIAQRTGLNIQVEPGVWATVLDKVQNRELDGLGCAVPTTERKQYLRFTSPLVSSSGSIIVRNDRRDVKKVKDLAGKSVALTQGSYMIEWLTAEHPDIVIKTYPSNQEAIEAVSFGEADAYVGNLAVAEYLMKQRLITNLTVVSKLENRSIAPAIGIVKEKRLLYEIMQKGLQSISEEERRHIIGKWHETSKETTILMSPEEKAWLDAHGAISLMGDPKWLPFEGFDKEGRYVGIVSNYVARLEILLGVPFHPIPTDSWSQTLDEISRGIPDVVSGDIGDLSHARLYRAITPYLSTPVVIVMRSAHPFVNDLHDIRDKRIAVIRGYGFNPRIFQQYPDIDFIQVENADVGIEGVLDRRYDAILLTMPKAGYLIRSRGLTDVKIVGKTAVEMKLTLLVKKSMPQLYELLERAMGSIDTNEQGELIKEWIDVEFAEKIDYTLLYQIITLFVLFIGGSLYWNRKLSIEIEERKQVQRALHDAKEAADAANRAKSEFLANMSHEIRTPMNAILGFAELLDEQLKDAHLQSYVRTIRSAGNTLLMLINDILDLSKIEAGKMQIEKVPVNPHELFREMGEIFTMNIRQKGLELVIDVDDAIPDSLLLDGTRVRQILFNLIGNAVKFTDEGYIRLFARKTEEQPDGSRFDLIIGVQDTGIGIPDDQTDRVFKIFEQQEGQSVRKFGGTGLGLSISKRLTETMGGSIAVQSRLNEGSTFTITLRGVEVAAVKPAAEEAAFDPNLVRFRDALILIVDDVENNRNLVKENFTGTRVRTIEASDGETAITLTRHEEPDLVLLDIKMPGMDGYQAAREIKEFSNVPIVALTASVMENEHKRFRESYFEGYLRKPVLRSDLFKELCRFLPHETIESEPDLSSETISEEALGMLPELLPILEGKMMQRWEAVSGRNSLPEIGTFAEALAEVARAHRQASLEQYAGELLERVEIFDITGMQMLIHEYPRRVASLRSLMSIA